MQPPDMPPRKMPLRALGWYTKFLMLFGGIWMSVGVPLTAVFLLIGRPFWADRALDERGVAALAKPLDVRRTASTVNRQRVYDIEVEFSGPAGRRTAVISSYKRGVISKARAGRSLPIEYDPQDPSLVRLEGGSASVFGLLALIPVPFAVIGGLLFGGALLSAMRQRKIYAHGTAVQGTVIGLTRTAARQNRRPVFRAQYSYQVEGQTYEGAVRALAPPAKGEPIWVIYDPERPEKSVAA